MRPLAPSFAFACTALASACATTPAPVPVNAPLTAAPVARTGDTIGADGDALALAFSGGGARAAAFSYGVLLSLRDMPAADGGRMIDHVALITAVSGGAITAAYFGQHGPAGLDGFRAAALDKDWAGRLHTSLLAPGNWMRALHGGVNGPRQLADWLDREVFAGGEMRDLATGPHIVLNATDLYNGAPFAFAPPYFNAICSDLGAVRIADAVAASMAVPLAFRPVVVETYAQDCPAPLPGWVGAAAHDRAAPAALGETARAFVRYRDPAMMRYVHLVDGGVVDNFGLSSLITMRRAAADAYSPFSARDAVRVRRMTFLVVNAEQSASGDWPMHAEGPSGAQVLGAALNDSINANKRVAYDAFARMLRDWERDLITYRCELPREEAARLGAGPGWSCGDVHFALDMISFADLSSAQAERLGAAPTRVSLPKPLIDDLIAAGREAANGNAVLRAAAQPPR